MSADVRVVKFSQPADRKARNRLAFGKALTKRVECYVRERSRLKRIIFTIHPSGVLELRLEKTRRTEDLLLADCYSLAVKMRVARERAEKAAAKKRGER